MGPHFMCSTEWTCSKHWLLQLSPPALGVCLGWVPGNRSAPRGKGAGQEGRSGQTTAEGVCTGQGRPGQPRAPCICCRVSQSGARWSHPWRDGQCQGHPHSSSKMAPPASLLPLSSCPLPPHCPLTSFTQLAFNFPLLCPGCYAGVHIQSPSLRHLCTLMWCKHKVSIKHKLMKIKINLISNNFYLWPPAQTQQGCSWVSLQLTGMAFCIGWYPRLWSQTYACANPALTGPGMWCGGNYTTSLTLLLLLCKTVIEELHL